MLYSVTPPDVLAFWREAGPALWSAQDRDFDARLRWTFFGAVQAAARGDLDWEATPDGALALVLLLDPFSRAVFRGVARADATNARAREIAGRAIARGFDQQVEPGLRRFFHEQVLRSAEISDQTPA